MKTDRSPFPRALALLAALSTGAFGSLACGVPEATAARADAPAPLSMAMVRARQAAPGHDFVADAAGTLRSKAGGAAVTATNRGVRLSLGDLELGVGTASVGRDAVRRARGVVGIHAEGQELVLARDGDVEERFLAGPLGVEQSFLVRTRPEGAGPLVVEVAFEGVVPERDLGDDHRVILRDKGGLVRGGYRDLAATDAEGHDLAARMEVRGTVVALAIDDSAAAYPVLVDPMVWTQTAELVANDGAGDALFGSSVALRGTTAILGTPACGSQFSGVGAAYVFVSSGGGWVQQAKLAASDGAPCDQFGQSVALSGDTALVGALGSSSAYVFVQSGTTWTQQAKLTVSGESNLGSSVALSGDTAVIGTYSGGGVYVFARQGTTWTQQAKLVGTDGTDAGDGFGWSVGADGATAIVGAYDAQVGSVPFQGAAYVFGQSGGVWTQQAELTASDGKSGDNFGYSVALSGGTAIVGAQKNVTANADQGAAYVFVQSGAIWSQQAELTASNGTPLNLFGSCVALSGDTAVVGGFDAKAPAQAAYVFARSGSTWAQQAEITANTAGSGNFGSALAIGDGIVLAGDASYPVDGNLFQGDAYVFTLGSPSASNSSSSSSSSASSSGIGSSGGTGGSLSGTSSGGSTGGPRSGSSSGGDGSSSSNSGGPVVLHGSCRAAGAPDESGMGAWLAVLGLAAVARRRAPRAR